jgi:hypothetical protein
MNVPVAAHLLQRIRSEYIEMPGLALRPEQVQRLCGVDGAACQTVLEALVETGFLSKRSDGAYGRDRNPDISRARYAKASLDPVADAAVMRRRLNAS